MIDRRPVAIDAALLIAVGVASWIWHPTAPRLGVAATCPGLLDAIAVGVARVRPAEALGPLLQDIDRAAFAAAMAVVVVVGRSLAARWFVPVAAVAAMGVVPAFDSSYGLPRAIALLGSLLAALLVLTGGQMKPRRRLAIWLSLAAIAAMTPALAVPMALLAAAATFVRSAADPRARRRRAVESVAAAGGVAMAAIAATSVVPSLGGAGAVGVATCMFGPAAERSESLVALIRAALSSTGPYVLALAALGACAMRNRWRAATLPLFASCAAAPFLAVLIAPVGIDVAVTPVVAAIWISAIVGLGELVGSLRGASGVVASTAFVLLLPWLAWSARSVSIPPGEVPLGHDELSLHSVQRALTTLPNQSALVQEDAIADVLVRASPAHNSISIVSLDRAAIDAAAARNGGHVYALPLAQLALRSMAYDLDDVATPGLEGVARVSPFGKCAGVITAWTDLRDVATSSSLALFARNESEAGPVVVYVSSDDAGVPRPVDWSADASKGFYAEVYDATPDQQERLRTIAAEDGLPSAWPGRTAPSVIRLELWRRPGAPLRLQVALGVQPTQAIAQLVRVQPAARLLICTASAHDVRPIRVLDAR